MNASETLTAAADRLASLLADEIAEGPWEYGQTNNPDNLGWWVTDRDGWVIFQGGEDDRWTEAEYAAAMNPVVGRALAEMLRRCVSHAELAQSEMIPQTQLVARALDVARAILREAAS